MLEEWDIHIRGSKKGKILDEKILFSDISWLNYSLLLYSNQNIFELKTYQHFLNFNHLIIFISNTPPPHGYNYKGICGFRIDCEWFALYRILMCVRCLCVRPTWSVCLCVGVYYVLARLRRKTIISVIVRITRFSFKCVYKFVHKRL